MLNTKTNTLGAKANMPKALYASSYVSVGDTVYIFGGIGTDGYSNSVFAYNITSNTWRTLSDLPVSFAYGQAVNINGIIYLIGGETADNCLKEIYTYNTENGSFTEISQMRAPRKDFGAVEFEGNIYIFGGSASFDPQGNNDLLRFGERNGVYTEIMLSSIEKLDVASGLCEKVDELDNAAVGLNAVSYFGNVYLIGEWDGIYQNKTQKYFGTVYPKNIQLTSKNDRLTIKWNKISEAESYEIEIDGSSYTSTTNSYSISASDSVEHSVRVCAVKNSKYSLWSGYKYHYLNSNLLDAKEMNFDFSKHRLTIEKTDKM